MLNVDKNILEGEIDILKTVLKEKEGADFIIELELLKKYVKNFIK